MKTLRSILEQDKDRFLGLLKGADREAAVHQIHLELDRVLFAFNDQDISDSLHFCAQSMVRTAKASSGWLDSEGEAVIYGRKEYRSGSGNAAGRKKNGKPSADALFWIFLAAGIFLLAALAIWLYMLSTSLDADHRFAVPILLIIPGAVCLFLAGLRLRSRGPGIGQGKEELFAKSLPEPEQVYKNLLAAILVMDESLKELEESEAAALHREKTQQALDPDLPELNLLLDLLEETWTGEEDLSREIRSKIKFYLHRRGMELCTYSQEHANWFDRIPSAVSGTIRPAIVMEGLLVRKGLAAP